jgi:hypothetical protein
MLDLISWVMISYNWRLCAGRGAAVTDAALASIARPPASWSRTRDSSSATVRLPLIGLGSTSVLGSYGALLLHSVLCGCAARCLPRSVPLACNCGCAVTG